jgi:hypothetical protein
MMLRGPQRQSFPDIIAGTLVLQNAPGSDGAQKPTS